MEGTYMAFIFKTNRPKKATVIDTSSTKQIETPATDNMKLVSKNFTMTPTAVLKQNDAPAGPVWICWGCGRENTETICPACGKKKFQ
jgi:rubrerythrin